MSLDITEELSSLWHRCLVEANESSGCPSGHSLFLNTDLLVQQEVTDEMRRRR